MRNLKVGIIGCGTILPMHAQPVVNLKGLELTCVSDVKKDRAKKAAKKYNCRYYLDYKKMLDKEELDAVHIATPHHLHLPMVEYAATKKINIFLEKPMGLNPKEAKKEIKICKKNKVRIGVCFQSRLNPSSQLVKKNLENGKLGKFICARLHLCWHKPDSYYQKSDWKGTWDKEGGGVVIDQAIHSLDMLRWLANDEIKYVEANVYNRMHDIIKVEDIAEGVIKFKKGGYIIFYCTNYYSYDAEVRMEVHCAKGIADILQEAATIYFKDGKKASAKPRKNQFIDYGEGAKSYWGVCHYNLIEDFYDALKVNRKPLVTAEDALKTQDMVWAIYESSKRNKKVCFK